MHKIIYLLEFSEKESPQNMLGNLQTKFTNFVARFWSSDNMLHSKTYNFQTITNQELKFWDMKIDF